MINPLDNPAFIKVSATLSKFNPVTTGNDNLQLTNDPTTFELHLQQNSGDILVSGDGIKGLAFSGYILKENLSIKPPLDSFFVVQTGVYSGTYQIVAIKDLSANPLITPIYKFDLIKLND